MGHETGRISLPSAAIVPMRHSIVTANNLIADMSLTLARRVWGVATDEQRQSAYHLMFVIIDQRGLRDTIMRGNTDQYGIRHAHVVARTAQILGADNLHATPHAPLKKKAGFLKRSDTRFHAGVAKLEFRGGYAYWATGKDAGDIEAAHDSWLGAAFFDALATVHWTRDTGGLLAESNGQQRSTVTSAWGPEGARRYPDKTIEYVMANGTHITRQHISERKKAA